MFHNNARSFATGCFYGLENGMKPTFRLIVSSLPILWLATRKALVQFFIYNVYLSMWNFKHKRWTCMVNHVYLPMWPCSNTLILIAISNGYTVHMTHSIILQFGVVNKHHIVKIIYSYCLYAKTLVYLLSNFDILLYNLFI